jgi:cytochrome c peroxidase
MNHHYSLKSACVVMWMACTVLIVLAQRLPPLPAGLPPVPIPANNQLTPAKVSLGRKLFLDPRLSADGTISCASCHKPEHFFADETPLSKGIREQNGERNAGSVLNAAYASHLLWDGRSLSLEDQVRYPVTHPREMNNTQDAVIKYISADPTYQEMFKQAFGDEKIDWERVTKAIASFERTLLTGNSAFDRFMSGDRASISKAAKRGFELFRGSAGCINCHSYSRESPFFSDFAFHNTGVGWAGSPDLGRYEVSKEREDKGAFRTPSLRNVARTGPYMHDGQMQSLQDVLEFYSSGGGKNPFLDKQLHPLNLSADARADLIAFLESLTGSVTYAMQAEVDAVDEAQAQSQPARLDVYEINGQHQPRTAKPDKQQLLPKSHAPFGRVEVIAGSSNFGDGGKAIDALFTGIGGLAVDHHGNVYLADTGGNRVRKIDAQSGLITTVAGNGLLFSAGESKVATEQPLLGPAPLALDSAERYLFVGEIIGRRVRRIELASGTIEDLGTPAGGFGKPGGLTWSSMGLLVADAPRGQVWKLEDDGGWTGLLPVGQRLRGGIRSVVADADGNIYIAEYFSHRVLRLNAESGQVETAVGTGEAGRVADGARAGQSPLRTPDGIAFDRTGNLVVADKDNHRICRVDSNGLLKTLIESGKQGTDERWTPGPIAFDAAGVLWIGDIHRNLLLRYTPGAAAPVVIAGRGNIRDGGSALDARFAHPGAVAVDADGNIYVSDTLHHRVRIIEAKTGEIHTLAGTGVPGFNGDGIPARNAWLGYPGKLQVDSRGQLYIGDYYNNRVRRVDLRTGRIHTVAGNGRAGEEGDGGLAERAPLLNPHALLLEADRTLIIVSAVSSKLRSVDLNSGQIRSVPLSEDVPETLVFYGITSWNGGLALAAPRPGSIEFLKNGKLARLLGPSDVVFPQDVAVSPQGQLYICETGRNRILKWNGKSLEVVVENLGRPRSIAFDSKGNLLIADTFHNRVLRALLEREPGKPLSARVRGR